LGRRLQEWHSQTAQLLEPRPAFAELKALELGQVTSASPKHYGKFGVNLQVIVMLLLLSVGASMLTHAHMWYLLLSVILVRLVQMVPYWRYRDVLPGFPPSQSADVPKRGAAAGAR